jgi:hypothetical protein
VTCAQLTGFKKPFEFLRISKPLLRLPVTWLAVDH